MRARRAGVRQEPGRNAEAPQQPCLVLAAKGRCFVDLGPALDDSVPATDAGAGFRRVGHAATFHEEVVPERRGNK